MLKADSDQRKKDHKKKNTICKQGQFVNAFYSEKSIRIGKRYLKFIKYQFKFVSKKRFLISSKIGSH